MNSLRRLAAVLAGVIVVASFITSAGAATLTFNDTSGTETGFIVQIIKSDGSVRFEQFPPNPGTGAVTLNLPNDGAGDCFVAAAFNAGGASAWTNRVCLAGNPPNMPTGVVAK